LTAPGTQRPSFRRFLQSNSFSIRPGSDSDRIRELPSRQVEPCSDGGVRARMALLPRLSARLRGAPLPDAEHVGDLKRTEDPDNLPFCSP
jgi:hypothetical protein